MQVQPIDSMVSSLSSGNPPIAQFTLDVREVLQARELPQKQMMAFLLLENAICHLYSSFKVPSQLVAMGWGSGITFNPLPWVLVPGV